MSKLLELALQATIRNERIENEIKRNKNATVVFKNEGVLNYIIPGTMKIKSFKNVTEKNSEKIAEFKTNDKTSLIL